MTRLILTVAIDLEEFNALLVANGQKTWEMMDEHERRKTIEDGLASNNDMLDFSTLLHAGEVQ
jgi:hypothetical protein